MAYHDGSVWPHDKDLIAQGFARYGMTEQAPRRLDGVFEAGARLDNTRKVQHR